MARNVASLGKQIDSAEDHIVELMGRLGAVEAQSEGDGSRIESLETWRAQFEAGVNARFKTRPMLEAVELIVDDRIRRVTAPGPGRLTRLRRRCTAPVRWLWRLRLLRLAYADREDGGQTITLYGDPGTAWEVIAHPRED